MIEVIVTSTVVAAMVGGFVSWRVSERRIVIENITQEREKWRDRIRIEAGNVHAAIAASDQEELSRLRSVFRLLLNPHDQEDLGILQAIVVGNSSEEEQNQEFSERVTLLLKHDWERAKREARPVLRRGGDPERITYEQYRHEHR